MNALDRLIGYFNPEKGLKRSMARARMSGITRARSYYDGATSSHRSGGWRTPGSDANQEIRLAGAKLRFNARDMCRNNPYAARAKSVIATNVVGQGIIPSAMAKNESVKERLEQLMVEHFDTSAIDAAGVTNLYGLQNLIMKTVVESGDVLVRLRPRRASDNLPLPFQIEVLEPDYLNPLIDGPQKDGNFAIQGIEYNSIGRTVKYHLFKEHPGNTTHYRGLDSVAVPADLICHIYRIDRPQQARGISWFAPVILRIRDFNDYSDAQLMRQKIAACFAAFVTGEVDETNLIAAGTETTPSEQRLQAFEPGMVEYLRPGENVEFAAPPGVANYNEYSYTTLHEIAAGLGISYEALTGDLHGVNFSSGRMGWLEFQRNIDDWRHTMLEPQFLQPLGKWFLQYARIAGNVQYLARDVSIKWTHPRREMISPKDEIPYMIKAVRAGFMTRSEVVRKQGYDPERVDKEFADDLARQDKLGLVYDTDGRIAEGGGKPEEPDESADGDKSASDGKSADDKKAA